MFADSLHERAFYQAVVDMLYGDEEDQGVDVLYQLESGKVIDHLTPGDASIFSDVYVPRLSVGSPPPESILNKLPHDDSSPPSALPPLPPLDEIFTLELLIEVNDVFFWSRIFSMFLVSCYLMFYVAILRVYTMHSCVILAKRLMMFNFDDWDVDIIGDTSAYNILQRTSRVELELKYNIYSPQNRKPIYPKSIFYMGHEKGVGQRSRTGNHRVLAGVYF